MKTSCEISLDLYNPDSKNDARVYVLGGLQPFCDANELKLDNNLQPKLYGTLEDKRWILDGSMVPFPDSWTGKRIGIWGQNLSNANGILPYPIILNFYFDEAQSCPGITFYFDRGGDLPYSLTVDWFDKDGNILYQSGGTPNSFEWLLKQPVENYFSIRIKIERLKQSYHYFKMNNIQFGYKLLFTGEQLLSATCISETDISGAELASGSIDASVFSDEEIFSILNSKGVYNSLHKQQRICVYKISDNLSEENYVLYNTYYLNDWSAQSKKVLKFSGQDTLGILEQLNFQGTWFQKTNLDYILKTYFPEVIFEIEADLNNIVVDGWLATCTKRDALQQICFAKNILVKVLPNGDLFLYQSSGSTVRHITRNEELLGETINLKDRVSSVEISAHTCEKSDIIETIYSGYLEKGTHILSIEKPYSEPVVEGATLLEAKGNTLKVNLDISAEIKITAKCAKQNSFVLEVKNDLIPNTKTLSITEATLVEPKEAADVAQKILNVYDQIYQQKLRTIAGKERVGDIVSAETGSTEIIMGNITRIETDLVGGLLSTIQINGKLMDTSLNIYTDYFVNGIYAGEMGCL